MLDALVAFDGPIAMHGVREHRSVFPRAIVVDSLGAHAGFAKNFRASRGQRLVGSACEITLLQPDVLEHSLNQGDMLRLPAVRAACNGQLLIAPAKRVESATGKKRH